MWRYCRRFFILFALLISLVFIQPVAAQSGDELFFPETRHSVRGDFYRFYQQLEDPLLLLGYPITEEFTDPLSNRKVQYFQRGRLDLVEQDGAFWVQIADLGLLIYEPDAPIVPLSTKTLACRLFQSTNKSVCYAFLQFYDAHQGYKHFGNPISELEIRDGRYVQYFERARMEWRPELPAGQRVALTDLGKIYFDIHINDPEIEGPVRDASIMAAPIELQTHAFVSQALAPTGSMQTVFVVVQDRSYQPVADATATVLLHLPGGDQKTYQVDPTNSNGISSLTFKVSDLPINEIIQMDIDVQFSGARASTNTWFRIWW